jgi:hypothetical protein
MPAIKSCLELKLIDFMQNFGRLGAAQGQIVNGKRTLPTLVVLIIQMRYFGMLVRSDIC